MKYLHFLILSLIVVGALGFSSDLSLRAPHKAFAQATTTGGTVGLQFVQNVWQNSSYGIDGEKRFPWGVFSLSDGYFVVTDGWCTHQSEKGGFKVFRDDGTFVGDGNTCTDSLASGENPDNLSLWAHQWGTGNENYAVVDGNSFIIGGEEGSSHPYPPKLYSVSDGSVSFEDAAWKLKLRSNASSNPPDQYALEESPHLRGYGVVGSKFAASRSPARAGERAETSIFSLPSLSLLDERTEQVSVLASIGNFVIARDGGAGSSVKLFTLSNSNRLTASQTLLSDRDVDAAYYWRGGFRDPLNANRFALREASNSRNASSRGDVHIFELRSGRAVETDLRKVPYGSNGRAPFALYGDYVIYARCDSNEGDSNRTDALAPCKLFLDNGTTVSSTAIPDDVSDGIVSGISVSRSGRVMVVKSGNAYLYRITNVVTPGGYGTSTPPVVITGSPPGTIPLDGIMGTLDLAKGYLLLLQAIFGKQTNDVERNIAPAGTSTQFQTIFQQAVDAINAY